MKRKRENHTITVDFKTNEAYLRIVQDGKALIFFLYDITGIRGISPFYPLWPSQIREISLDTTQLPHQRHQLI